MRKRNVQRGGRGWFRLALQLITLAFFVGGTGWDGAGVASAAQAGADAAALQEGGLEGRREDPADYRTPLAGEAGEASFLGRRITIPALDRRHMTSITLGGSLFEPKQGDNAGLPVAALFLRRFWPDSRTRNVISLFVNELEYARRVGELELVGHFENYTLPFDQTELVDNEEIESTSVRWGTLLASLGPGLRLPVAPYQADNDFRLQLLGRVGYLYAERSHDTGPTVVVPPNTMLYGARLRVSYDAMRRNLLELPHSGLAAGFDLDYLHRDRWRSLDPTGSGSIHRNYLQGSGHLVAVGGLPGLSERNRLLFSLYGGTTNDASADRFNALLINGGPFPGEQDDMARVHYTGLVYQDVRTTSYATVALGYRRELAFFLYLSGLGSYLWAERATVQGVDQVVFRDVSAAAATVSLDCAFFWKSALYLAYSWESEFMRGGKAGHGVILTWNKLF